MNVIVVAWSDQVVGIRGCISFWQVLINTPTFKVKHFVDDPGANIQLVLLGLEPAFYLAAAGNG